MNQPFTAKACGKFILLGDHFVAHGSPALAFPVPELFCKIELMLQTASESFALIKDQRPPKNIEEKMTEAFRCAVSQLGIQKSLEPVCIRSYSNFDTSRGFGSSAAFSVALLRTMMTYQKQENIQTLTEERIPEVLQALEKLFHANPSGVDATTIWNEKAIFFQKNHPVQFIKNTTVDFILADAGERNSTAELVERVGRYREKNITRWEELSHQVSSLVRECKDILSGPTTGTKLIAEAITEGHKILTEIGLSNPRIEDLISKSKSLGGLAGKISGAGTGGALVIVTERGQGEKLKQKMLDEKLPVIALVKADDL